MGGFAFDIRQASVPSLPLRRRYLTITPQGAEFLLKMKPNIILNITKAQIQDKSKNNDLAKLLVCIQALWFIVQTLHRLFGKLTLSLLELNTLGHGICTILIYFVWWDKPLGVTQPTLIDDTEAFPLATFMSILFVRWD